MQIEFEKKFILNLDAQSAILAELYSKKYGSVKVEHIWQCYGAKKDNRYRATVNHRTGEISAIKEVKKGIKIPVHYSVNLESDDKSISALEFMKKFARSNKRLCKLRWTLKGTDIAPHDPQFPREHKVMIDLFVPVPKTLRNINIPYTFDVEDPYALMAEVETVLDVNTTALHLDFRLPSFLQPHLIHTVDKRTDDKAFAAYTLCYTPEVAESTRELVRRLKNGNEQL